jgi:hemoglobin/transferrin/lactoferrin receptor protein
LKVYSFLILLLFPFAAAAQKAFVSSKLNDLPIAKVSIKLYDDSNSLEFFSGDDGSTPLPKTWRKQYLVFSAPGYNSLVVKPSDWTGKRLKVSLSPMGMMFSEFEVLSSRMLIPSKSLPIDVLNIRNPSSSNPQTMADVLERSGEVFVQKSQLGGGSPVLRGMEANRILLVMDGVRLNTPIFRAGHLQNILRSDPNITSNLEVIQGSASPFYGSDAIGGVISINTYEAILPSSSDKLEATGGAKLTFSSGNFEYWDQEKSGHLWFNLGYKHLAVRTAFTVNSFGDLRQGAMNIREEWKRPVFAQRFDGKDSAVINIDPLLQKGSGFNQFSFAQRWVLSKPNGLKHQLNIQYTKSSDVNRYDRLSELNNNKPVFSEWYYGPEERALISYQLNLNKRSVFYNDGRIVAAYQLNRESRSSRRFQSDDLTSRFEEVNSLSLNADFKKKIKSNHIYYGLEIYHHSISSKAFTENIVSLNKKPASTRYPSGGSEVNNLSFYLTSQQSYFDKRLIITGGIRLTYNNLIANFAEPDFYPFPFSSASQLNNTLCGQLGLVYSYNKRTKFKTLWSQGFRAPNIDDLAKVFDSNPGILIVPNNKLKAERSNSFELGFVFNETGALSFEIGTFITLLENAIVTREFKFNGQDSVLYDGQLSKVYANINADKSEIYGGSMRIKWRINSKTDCALNSTFTYGDAISNSISLPQDHIPPLFGRFQLNRKITDKIQSSIWVIYNAEKPLNRYSPGGEDNLEYATVNGMPAWQTINLSTKFIINKNSSLDFMIENILDTNYRTFASGISASGRLIRLACNVTF